MLLLPITTVIPSPVASLRFCQSGEPAPFSGGCAASDMNQ